ncbi:MAG: hypothetical protein WA476_03355 [Acidobacteriaceae bacterium]
MKPFSDLWQRSNEVGVQFVMTELELAASFLDVAAYSSASHHRNQSIDNASRAYASVQHFLPRLHFTDSQAASIQAKVNQIRRRLESSQVDLQG